jgi:3-hydroxymyristoyl/3-hydroxydecanoyl-(acyl carrier protein) dehydratase
MQQIILIFIFIAEFFTSPKNVLFYDQPEYLRIVSTHPFWQVFSLGHFPIHPIFLGILWITTKFISGNQTALLFGVISVIFVFKISKLLF